MSKQTKKSPAGQLRIVAGNWRSRRLQIANVAGLRPTASRIRETLFNWLAHDVQDARCLDLCAGTGALGIEALSRGAAGAVFVESSNDAAMVLRSNLARLDAVGAEVHQADAREFLARQSADRFDIVFLDPPFAAEMHGELCRLLNDQCWLARNASIYLELDKDQAEPQLPANWRVMKNKTAGNVRYMLMTTAIQEDDS